VFVRPWATDMTTGLHIYPIPVPFNSSIDLVRPLVQLRPRRPVLYPPAPACGMHLTMFAPTEVPVVNFYRIRGLGATGVLRSTPKPNRDCKPENWYYEIMILNENSSRIIYTYRHVPTHNSVLCSLNAALLTCLKEYPP
jgi:hypothetical protein